MSGRVRVSRRLTPDNVDQNRYLFCVIRVNLRLNDHWKECKP